MSRLYDILDKLVNRTEFKVVYVTLTASGNISSGGTTQVIQTDVSASLTGGYKLLFAMPRGTANNNAYFWYFDFYNTTVEYRLKNVGQSAFSTTPTARLLLVKE